MSFKRLLEINYIWAATDSCEQGRLVVSWGQEVGVFSTVWGEEGRRWVRWRMGDLCGWRRGFWRGWAAEFWTYWSLFSMLVVACRVFDWDTGVISTFVKSERLMTWKDLKKSWVKVTFREHLCACVKIYLVWCCCLMVLDSVGQPQFGHSHIFLIL